MGKIIRVDFPQKTGKTGEILPDVYQFKIVLQGTYPVVWRRLQIPCSFSLAGLHDIILIAMGWDDTPLHQFNIGREIYGRPAIKHKRGGRNVIDERKCSLRKLKAKILNTFIYEYNLAGFWRYEIKLERVVVGSQTILRHPILLAGEHACSAEGMRNPARSGDFFVEAGGPEKGGDAALLYCFSPESNHQHAVFAKINRRLRQLG